MDRTNVGSNETLYGMTSSTGNSFDIMLVDQMVHCFDRMIQAKHGLNYALPLMKNCEMCYSLVVQSNKMIIAGKNGTLYRSDNGSGNCDPTGIENHLNPYIIGLTVYSNPSTHSLRLSYEMISNQDVEIAVFDITGKLIYIQNAGMQSVGSHVFELDVSNWSTGLYSL